MRELRSYKISPRDLQMFLVILPLYRPTYLAQFAWLDDFFFYGKIIAFLWIVMLWAQELIVHKVKIDVALRRSMPLFLGLMFTFFLSAIIHDNVFEVGSVFLPVLTCVLAYWLCLKWKWYSPMNLLRPLKLLMSFYVIINFITIVMFPDGMYSMAVSGISTASNNKLWFLGYKNSQIRFILPTVCFSMICDIVKYSKIRRSTYFLLFLSVLSIVLTRSATALLSIIMFVFFFIMYKKRINVKPVWFIWLNVIFFVGVIILRFHKIFSFFIVDIMGKDITLSARTRIWDVALLQVISNPALGSSSFVCELAAWYKVTHPHNFILYILIKGGIVGLFFTVFILRRICKEIGKYRSCRITQILNICFCSFFVITLTESITEATYFYLLLAMCMSVGELCKYDRKYIQSMNGSMR